MYIYIYNEHCTGWLIGSPNSQDPQQGSTSYSSAQKIRGPDLITVVTSPKTMFLVIFGHLGDWYD